MEYSTLDLPHECIEAGNVAGNFTTRNARFRAAVCQHFNLQWVSVGGTGNCFLYSVIRALREAGLLADLRLLHFHVGSQINDIAVLKDALQEAGQIYVELTKLGAPMGYLDVGGGLGIDYDGSRTASAASTNYSLQNYANDVVATVRECCEPHGVAVPTLVSESGRAIASHFSVLVFDVLGAGGPPASVPAAGEGEALILRNLRDVQGASILAENRDIREVHILASPGRSAKHIVRDVETCLRTRFSIELIIIFAACSFSLM